MMKLLSSEFVIRKRTEPTTVVDWSEGYPQVVRVGAGDPARFE